MTSFLRPPVRSNYWLEDLEGKCIGLSPPILIDNIVRPDGWEKDKPIGSLWQGARRLPDHVADLLQKKLEQEAPDVYREIFG